MTDSLYTLWRSILSGQSEPLIEESKMKDNLTLMSDDYSYILSNNPNTKKHNIVDALTHQQRLDHPKIIHKHGFVGRFEYVPLNFFASSNGQGIYPEMMAAAMGANIMVTNMMVGQEQLHAKRLMGVFRCGPANLCDVNMIGLAIKFYRNEHTPSVFNTLMIGGTATPIDPVDPPSIGDIASYSTDISSIDTSANKNVRFLTKAFTDLTPNPNAINVEKFIKGYKKMNFRFNSRLLEKLKSVQHNQSVVRSTQDVINEDMKQHDDQKINNDYILGTIYVVDNDDDSLEYDLGHLILSDPVLVSNFADKYLFFQHDLDNVRTDKDTIEESKKCPFNKSNYLNENVRSRTSLCHRFFRRLGYYASS